MMFSVILSTYSAHKHYLPRALECLAVQTCRDFEVLLVIDGKRPLFGYEPRAMVKNLMGKYRDLRVSVTFLEKGSAYGNYGRWYGAQIARGDYCVWYGSDNLIFPIYLESHAQNINRQPGCVSVVNIDYWSESTYWRTLPSDAGIDLLCYAIPTSIAREEDLFGGEAMGIVNADAIAYSVACTRAPSVHDPLQPVCGAHF